MYYLVDIGNIRMNLKLVNADFKSHYLRVCMVVQLATALTSELEDMGLVF